MELSVESWTGIPSAVSKENSMCSSRSINRVAVNGLSFSKNRGRAWEDPMYTSAHAVRAHNTGIKDGAKTT